MGYFEERARKTLLGTEFTTAPAFPANSLVELTNGCNHACVFCKNSNQKRRATNLDMGIYKTFIEQASRLGLKEVGLYATGEPFMTKNLHEYVRIAKSNGIRRVYITTNGALAKVDAVKKCVDAGLDSIKFSINAANREDYKYVHGYDDFQTVLKNLDEIYSWKNAENVDLQLLCSCVIIPAFPHTKEKHFQIFEKYFEDIAYIEAASQGGQSFEIPMSENELSKIFTEKGVVEDEDLSPCSMVFNRYHLTAEGYLTACCVDYDLNLVFADLNEENLESAWLNKYITELREKHIARKLDGTICHQCLKNKKLPFEPLRKVASKDFKNEDFVKRQEKLLERISEQSKAT
ncbi:radical SAM/SPASM domain-containing protein [Tepidicaulis sp.]|uniref:radical SAM/SPASM domain-containing protein n=1 Tax=Tepidicaulis sp. TaxID=1920809 RepID=UPI003B5B1CC2